MTITENSQGFVIDEYEEQHYTSLEDAQKESLSMLTSSIVAILHDLIEQGKLYVKDGCIVVNVVTRPHTNNQYFDG